MLAEVHTIYETNARSVADMLRQAADNIEAEPEIAVAMVAVQIDSEGKIGVYGWGDTNVLHAAGLLHCGLQKVVDMQLDNEP
jgi:hypothetical protein